MELKLVTDSQGKKHNKLTAFINRSIVTDFRTKWTFNALEALAAMNVHYKCHMLLECIGEDKFANNSCTCSIYLNDRFVHMIDVSFRDLAHQ